MDRDHSWIDRDALRALVAETAWRRPKDLSPDESETARGGRLAGPRFTQTAAAPPAFAVDSDLRGGLPPPPPPTPEFAPSTRVGGDRLTRASRPLRPGSIDPSAVTIRVPLPPPPAYVRSAADPYVAAHQTPIDERLDQLLVWALESSGMESAFVADREGQLVAARDVVEADEASTTVFEQFLRQCEGFVEGRVDGHVLLRAGSRRLLVTWRYTPRGRYYLGLAGRGQAPVDAVESLGQALVDALEVA